MAKVAKPIGPQKLVPGRRHLSHKNSGHPSGGIRSVWYERSCDVCGAVTRGGMKRIRQCAGGGHDYARNHSPKPGCGRRFDI